MAENSLIEWTDDTWNPWQGCRPVGIDCENCYMFRDKKRYGKDPLNIHRSADRTFAFPLRLDAGRVVFVCSWSDFYIEEADAWRGEAWDIIRRRRDLIFIIPTKRPERIAPNLPEDWHGGWRNVYHLLSAGNQETLDARMPDFVHLPGNKGLSLEPLIGPIDFHGRFATGTTNWLEHMDQVIVGGESGPGARTMHPAWVRLLRDQCEACQVHFYFKQWGEWVPRSGKVAGGGEDFSGIDPGCRQWPRVLRIGEHGKSTRDFDNCGPDMGEEVFMQRVGVRRAGRLLYGEEHNDLIWKREQP
jgi:protein gp37